MCHVTDFVHDGHIWAILKRCIENWVFFLIDKNANSPCKVGNILILINSRQTKKAGRAFQSKYDHLIWKLWQILLFFDASFEANKWDISTRTQNNCLSQDTPNKQNIQFNM